MMTHNTCTISQEFLRLCYGFFYQPKYRGRQAQMRHHEPDFSLRLTSYELHAFPTNSPSSVVSFPSSPRLTRQYWSTPFNYRPQLPAPNSPRSFSPFLTLSFITGHPKLSYILSSPLYLKLEYHSVNDHCAHTRKAGVKHPWTISP